MWVSLNLYFCVASPIFQWKSWKSLSNISQIESHEQQFFQKQVIASIPRYSTYGIFTNIWVVLGVNGYLYHTLSVGIESPLKEGCSRLIHADSLQFLSRQNRTQKQVETLYNLNMIYYDQRSEDYWKTTLRITHHPLMEGVWFEPVFRRGVFRSSTSSVTNCPFFWKDAVNTNLTRLLQVLQLRQKCQVMVAQAGVFFLRYPGKGGL